MDEDPIDAGIIVESRHHALCSGFSCMVHFTCSDPLQGRYAALREMHLHIHSCQGGIVRASKVSLNRAIAV